MGIHFCHPTLQHHATLCSSPSSRGVHLSRLFAAAVQQQRPHRNAHPCHQTDIVNHRRGKNAQFEQKYPADRDKARNHRRDKPSFHIAVEFVYQVQQGRQLSERLIHHDNLCSICRHRRSPAERDRDIGLPERQRVVDAVADKTDFVACGLQTLHMRCLVSWQCIGKVVVDPQVAGQFLGRLFLVSRDDIDLNLASVQIGDDLRHLGSDRRFQFDRTCQVFVDRNHHDRMALAVRPLQQVCDRLWHRDSFHLYKTAAADPDLVTGDLGLQAVADDILGVVDRWQGQPLSLGGRHNRARDRVALA